MKGQLTIDGTDDVWQPVMRDGYCGCGCGDAVLDGRTYLSATHRQRAYRRRVREEMVRVGLPASPSLRAARVSRPTGSRNGDAQTARNGSQRRRSGLQVSYFKAVEVLTAEVGASRLQIELALEQALPARQRQILEQRDAA